MRRRFGQIIKLKPEGQKEYVRLHQNVWPGVLQMISKCRLVNYSIFLKNNTLFAFFEYEGHDFDADMKKMAGHEETQRWWDIVKPLMEPLETAGPEDFWVNMEEIFHLD